MDKMMTDKISQLKEQYRVAKTQADFDRIEQEMDALASQDNKAFSEAMVALAHETAKEAATLAVRRQLEKILPMISVAYIAKTYFGKSKEWLYQRINGNTVNGKPATFTPKELDILNNALQSMGNLLLDTHVS